MWNRMCIMEYSTLSYVIMVTLMGFVQSQSRIQLLEKCYNEETGRWRCYSLYEGDARGDDINWPDAAELCTINDTRLASMETDDEWENVKDVIQEARIIQGHGVWTAGRRSDDNSWKYLRREETTMLNGDFPSVKYCARMSRENQRTNTQSRPCTDVNYGICQRSVDSSDEDNCDLVKPDPDGSDNVCLNLIPTRMTWFEARDYCRTTYRGGDLADVDHDVAEYPATETQGMDLSGYGVWIGLQRRPWLWRLSDNNEVPMQRYHFTGPEGTDRMQSCLFLRQNEPSSVSWADQDCLSTVKYYLCQSDSTVGKDGINPDARGGSGPTTAEEVSTSNTVYIAVAISLVGVASISGVLIFLYIRRRQMIRQKENEERMRNIRHVTDMSSDSSERPRISAPIPLDAPYPVSGYSNLGPLVPVTPEGETQQNGDQMYSEIPVDAASSPPASGFIMFGDGLPYANIVNFAETDPSATSGYQMAPDVAAKHYGSSGSVDHVTAHNGDEYALSSKPVVDHEDDVVDNLSYHSRY